MSSSQNFLDGRKAGKAPEKSNFAQTCNLLSQYLKGKGSIGDLNLQFAGKPEAIGKSETSPVTTLDLLPNTGHSGQSMNSIDLFPQYVAFGSSSVGIIEDASNKAISSKSASAGDSKMAQMTIFYGGQVLVFDEFPADKAREVLLLASKASSCNTESGLASTANADKKIDLNNDCSLASDPSSLPSSPVLSTPPQERLQPKTQGAVSSELPIARRGSLHRFLEKRKDRAAARAPYQQVHNPSAGSSKQDEQLELKL